MRVAVFGSDGVGGHFGALLARAGHEVTFIARRAHLEAMHVCGLPVRAVPKPIHAQAQWRAGASAEASR